MSLRYYVAPVTGTGTDADPYRPNLPEGTIYIALMPSNKDGTPRLSWVLCLIDAEDHGKLETDSSLVALPLTPDTPMSTLPQNLRSQYGTRLRQSGYNITIDFAADTAADVVDKMTGSVGSTNARGAMRIRGKGWGDMTERDGGR